MVWAYHLDHRHFLREFVGASSWRRAGPGAAEARAPLPWPDEMPFTFFAHQAPVLPLKTARPQWFDGTALCVGSMAPDLGYPIGLWVEGQTHSAIGLLTWSLPATLVICWAIRRWVAATAFAHVPDTPARLHSLRVLGLRRPPWWQTVTSALVGAGTHVLIDAFTHRTRFGARWLGLDHQLGHLELPLSGPVSPAGILQYLGHTVGSLVGMVLLVRIARRGLIEEWYGAERVATARRFTLTPAARRTFWAIVGATVLLGIGWTFVDTHGAPFVLIDALALGVAVASAVPRCRPAPPLGGAATVGDSATDHAARHPQLPPDRPR